MIVCWKIYEKAQAVCRHMKIQTKQFNERRTNAIKVIKKVKLTPILSSVHVDYWYSVNFFSNRTQPLLWRMGNLMEVKSPKCKGRQNSQSEGEEL